MAFLKDVILNILIVAIIVQTDMISLRIQFLSLRIHDKSKARATAKEIASMTLILNFLMLIRVLLRI